MKKFLAAISAALAINVFAGVQVTKQYCDHNAERAISNSVSVVKERAPGIITNYMKDARLPFVITNEIYKEVFTTNIDVNIHQIKNEYFTSGLVATNGTVECILDGINYKTIVRKNEIVEGFVFNSPSYSYTMCRDKFTNLIPSHSTAFGSAKFYKPDITRFDYDKKDRILIRDERQYISRPSDSSYYGRAFPIISVTSDSTWHNIQYLLGFEILEGIINIDEAHNVTNYVTATSTPHIGSILYFANSYSETYKIPVESDISEWTRDTLGNNQYAAGGLFDIETGVNYTSNRYFFFYVYGQRLDLTRFFTWSKINTGTTTNRIDEVDQLTKFSDVKNYAVLHSADEIITNQTFLSTVMTPLIQAKAQAQQAATDANTYKGQAQTFAANAQQSYNDIQQFSNWFEQHKGQVITNNYYAEDTFAREVITNNLFVIEPTIYGSIYVIQWRWAERYSGQLHVCNVIIDTFTDGEVDSNGNITYLGHNSHNQCRITGDNPVNWWGSELVLIKHYLENSDSLYKGKLVFSLNGLVNASTEVSLNRRILPTQFQSTFYYQLISVTPRSVPLKEYFDYKMNCMSNWVEQTFQKK